jgi:hypothetical protein
LDPEDLPSDLQFQGTRPRICRRSPGRPGFMTSRLLFKAKKFRMRRLYFSLLKNKVDMQFDSATKVRLQQK